MSTYKLDDEDIEIIDLDAVREEADRKLTPEQEALLRETNEKLRKQKEERLRRAQQLARDIKNTRRR